MIDEAFFVSRAESSLGNEAVGGSVAETDDIEFLGPSTDGRLMESLCWGGKDKGNVSSSLTDICRLQHCCKNKALDSTKTLFSDRPAFNATPIKDTPQDQLSCKQTTPAFSSNTCTQVLVDQGAKALKHCRRSTDYMLEVNFTGQSKHQ